MTTVTTTYLSAAETAKLVRKSLKANFPDTKFSVRSETYAGGASINVRWTDGPIDADVEPFAKMYQGGGFDGSIDMAYSLSHWIRPDGSVLVAHNPGTMGSTGKHIGEDNRDLAPVIPEDAKLVRFGADHIFCHRQISDFADQTTEAVIWFYEHCDLTGTSGNPDVDQFGNYPVRLQAQYLVRNRREGERWQDVLMRCR